MLFRGFITRLLEFLLVVAKVSGLIEVREDDRVRATVVRPSS